MRRRDIEIPWHVRRGIRHRKGGFAGRLRFFSGDVETCHGEPITLQLADNAKQGDILWVNQYTILPAFLDWIEPRLLKKQVNVCFFHYMDHDLPALLYEHRKLFSSSNFKFKACNVEIEVLAGKMFYGKIKFEDDTVLHLIDTYRFYTTSLEKAGKALGCTNMKYKRPYDIGSRRYKPSDTYFVNYALQDALLGYEIAAHIVKIHEEYDIPISISAPQFAARVFTRYYLKEGEKMPFPGRHVSAGALYSYHGGKNGFYVDPGAYHNVTELDISSAYPNAMKMLPQFIKGKYEYVGQFDPAYVGVYKVCGTLKECRYAIFMSHEGKALYGPCRIENLWITSFELQESMRTGEFVLESASGWRWSPDITYPNNPLADYVDNFYKKKESCKKDSPEYVTYKLLLNGLYGKFIQNIEVDSEVQAEWVVQEDGTRTRVKKTYKAGGLFNPFIATLITGQVRAYLHRLEHDYSAIHSSTDSIKTMMPIAKESLPKGLGGLGVVVTGDCIILRNKLYAHYEGPRHDCKFARFIRNYCRPHHVFLTECWPKKYALHGFWGDIRELMRIIETKNGDYEVNHLYKVREALAQNLIPLKTYRQERRLEIDWQKYNDIRAIFETGASKENRAETVHSGK